MYWFFLCISSCTPEIYTSCHTLSLPYPLPISPPNFGQAPEPSPEPSTNPLFSAAEAKVPAAAPLPTPSEFDTVLSPFIARAFATGIDRKRVVSGKSVLVRVELGGRLIITNTISTHFHFYNKLLTISLLPFILFLL